MDPTLSISRTAPTVPPQGPELTIDTHDRPEGLLRRDDPDSRTLPTGTGQVRDRGSQEISRPTQLENYKKPNILLRILAAIPEICANIVLLGAPALQKYMESRGISHPPYTFTMPGTHGRKVEVDGHIGPKKIPKGMTHEEVQTQLQEKIDAGHKVFEAVSRGDRTDGCTVDDMTNLMFFLQVRGEDRQGSSFKDGTFNLPDPGGRLRKFLDSCPEAYQRSSSFAPEEGHRGIDAYGSGKKRDQLLPHHMKTLHYFSVPKSDTMPEDRIILKMEANGKFFSRPKVSDPDGPSRSSNRHDLGATMKHVFKGTGKPGTQTFTEQLPAAVKHEYREIMRYLPPQARQEMERNGPFDREGGLRVMYDNANRVLAGAYSGEGEELTPEVQEKLEKFILKLQSNYPDPSVRFGNEVVFSVEDLIMEPEPEITPEPEVEVQTEPPTLTGVERQIVPPGPMLVSDPVLIAPDPDPTKPTTIDSPHFAGRISSLRDKMNAWNVDHADDRADPRAFDRLTSSLARYQELMDEVPEMDLFASEERLQEIQDERQEALTEYQTELRKLLHDYATRMRVDDEPGHDEIQEDVEKLVAELDALKVRQEEARV